jgi:L-alanine-DL-glutamate epimerase-like enolase superfamily enzyme
VPEIHQLDVSAYTIPTDRPESDGTLKWDSTTIVIVEVMGGGQQGIGYTYGDLSTARIIDRKFAPIVIGKDAFQIPEIWVDMVHSVRNIGRPGVSSMAIAAVDAALWDLKARILDVPLISLLGRARHEVAIYGSGGFTSYSDEELEEQLGGWAAAGIEMVKMKVGRDAAKDPERVARARRAIGAEAQLFVDANGAYTRKQAVEIAAAFEHHDVKWFEEPVSSDDLCGLRFVRDHAPARMRIAAGEYGYDSYYFQRMLEAGAVDVLQIDGTRCGGITGFMKAAEIADAHQIHVSAHTAPALHVDVCCCAPRVLHLEYFHDHVRIENMIFDGVIQPSHGMLRPDLSRPGNGLQIKRSDAARFAA